IGEALVGTHIECNYIHHESARNPNDMDSDMSSTHHPERFAPKVKSLQARRRKMPAAGAIVSLNDLARETEYHSTSMFCDGVITIDWYIRYGNSARFAVAQINMIVPGGSCRNKLQVRNAA